MCTCNYMYTNHRKHYINNYMEVSCKDYWEFQRNFKVQETVQVKELEESLEKIKTQMEEARRQVCLRDLAGRLCLSRYYTWA